jgi:uncharacterized membrane protein YbhN (UPF0104 family)
MNVVRKRILHSLMSAAFLGLSVAIVLNIPRLTHTTWANIFAVVGNLSLGSVLVIAGLWVGGLVVYTIAMTSSMPGLTHRQALALNLAGSSASNLLPFGGALGTGINLAMVRSWRLSVRHFASSTAVLTIVNLMTKLILPIIAGIVLAQHKTVAPWLTHSAYIAAIVAATITVALIWALTSRTSAARLDDLLRRVTLRRHAGSAPAVPVTAAGAVADVGDPAGTAPAAELGPVSTLQVQVRDVLRLRWLGLSAGMIGYILLQWALFAMCLHAAGVGANPASVFAAFAVERALTLAVVTPAGTGIAESLAVGLLVALGFPPAPSAAGVLLYRLFVFLAEIPVGVAVLGGWASMRIVRRRSDAAAAANVGTAETAAYKLAEANLALERDRAAGTVVSKIPAETTMTPPTPSKM